MLACVFLRERGLSQKQEFKIPPVITRRKSDVTSKCLFTVLSNKTFRDANLKPTEYDQGISATLQYAHRCTYTMQSFQENARCEKHTKAVERPLSGLIIYIDAHRQWWKWTYLFTYWSQINHLSGIGDQNSIETYISDAGLSSHSHQSFTYRLMINLVRWYSKATVKLLLGQSWSLTFWI